MYVMPKCLLNKIKLRNKSYNISIFPHNLRHLIDAKLLGHVRPQVRLKIAQQLLKTATIKELIIEYGFPS